MRAEQRGSGAHLAPAEVDGSQLADVLLSALRTHAGAGQDLRGVFVEPAEPFVLDVHFFCEGLRRYRKQPFTL